MLYEVWFDDSEECNFYTFVPANAKKKILEPTAKIIHVITASNWNEAMKLYYEYMGWEPYKPMVNISDYRKKRR